MRDNITELGRTRSGSQPNIAAVLLYKAYRGERFKLPVLGEIAERIT